MKALNTSELRTQKVTVINFMLRAFYHNKRKIGAEVYILVPRECSVTTQMKSHKNVLGLWLKKKGKENPTSGKSNKALNLNRGVSSSRNCFYNRGKTGTIRVQ